MLSFIFWNFHFETIKFFKLFYEKCFGFSFLDIFKNVQFDLNFFSLTDEILLIFFTSFVMIFSVTTYPIIEFFNTIILSLWLIIFYIHFTSNKYKKKTLNKCIMITNFYEQYIFAKETLLEAIKK